MAADKLMYASGNSASTTLSSGITNSDTSAPLTSDTNFNAKSGEGMVILDESTANEELAYATTKTGGALTIPLANRGLEGGSAQQHSAQATVKGIVSAGMWNNLIDAVSLVVNKVTGLLNKASGSDVTTGTSDTTIVTPKALKDGTLTGQAIASPVLSGAGATAAGTLGFDGTDHAILIGNGTSNLPMHIYHWKTYTPTTTNVTVGSGTLTGRYCQIGKTVHLTIELTWAADTSFGGAPDFSLPVASTGPAQQMLDAFYYDAAGGNGYNFGKANLHLGNQKLYAYAIKCDSTYSYYAAVSATVPMTWTTSDVLVITGTYEAA